MMIIISYSEHLVQLIQLHSGDTRTFFVTSKAK